MIIADVVEDGVPHSSQAIDILWFNHCKINFLLLMFLFWMV